MNSKAQSKTDTNKPVEGSREHYLAWQAEQEAIAKAQAIGSPEIVALRKLAHLAEHIFESEGITHRAMTPCEILSEALRCAQSDFAVLGDADMSGSGSAAAMVYRRAEMRIDLALALAEFRAEFPVTAAVAEAAE